MSRDYDRKRRVVTYGAKKRAPIRIVHLNNGSGRALCGLSEPYPSDCHTLASLEGEAPHPLDVCLTCKGM